MNCAQWTHFALSAGCPAEPPQCGSYFVLVLWRRGPQEIPLQLRALSQAITACLAASTKCVNSRAYSYGTLLSSYRLGGGIFLADSTSSLSHADDSDWVADHLGDGGHD